MPEVPSTHVDSHKEPVLTLRITEDTAIRLAVLAVVAVVFLILAIRPWDKPQPASMPGAPAQQLSIARPETLRTEASHSTVEPQQMRKIQPDEPAQQTAYNYSVAVHEELPQPMPIKVLDLPPSDASLQPELVTNAVLQPIVPLVSLGPTILHGAGATFPYLLYRKWFEEIHRINPQIDINYQAIGSGGGIRQVLGGTIDFGASDIPMTDNQLSQTTNRIVYIPTVLDAVVPIYNLSGTDRPLRFTPAVLSGIYRGKIISWNDPEIAAANPGINLPPTPIVVVHRSDGSATTFLFTDYLSKVSSEWERTSGRGTSVKWSAGLGGKANEGVAALVRQMEGAIGYVDFTFAAQNGLAYGSVLNASGKFVKASVTSITASAAAIREMPYDFRPSITNSAGDNSYPISGFTWLLIPDSSHETAKRQALIASLNWILTDGQSIAPELYFAPLPRSVALKALQRIARLQ